MRSEAPVPSLAPGSTVALGGLSACKPAGLGAVSSWCPGRSGLGVAGWLHEADRAQWQEQL